MQIATLVTRLQQQGARPAHVARLLRGWLQRLPDDHGPARLADFLPLAVRREWPALAAELAGLARVTGEAADGAGATRLLVELSDGQTVESVLLPKGGVCVSTQVGCAVGCRFCMTGRDGLLRQLSGGEIVAQVVLARARQPVKKVVFMGMGEPAHNLDAVCAAIEALGTHGAIGHKNLVLSTVGDQRVFARLPTMAVKPALALSLHSTKAALRAALMPHAPHIAPQELVALCTAYAEATGYPIQYQWTLLAGVNDGDDEIDGIARLLAGRYAVMNLIPWNAVDGGGYARPGGERLMTMARELNARGVLTKLRDSAGQDIDGGCGQLRARRGAAPEPVAGGYLMR
jgi:23S rRNA (adenine2503-C2)-methyltransferase